MSGNWDLGEFVPANPDDVLALGIEELARCLLGWVAAKPPVGISDPDPRELGIYSQRAFPSRTREINVALGEAWGWLVRECLLIPKVGDTNRRFIISRKGRSVLQAEDWTRFLAERSLPREHLHPKIANAVVSDFFRGDYESAVFKAFKAVEVAVRDAAGLPNSTIGTDLMRKAFGVGKELADPEAESAEQEAMAHLSAGAIGLMKNPSSHRYVGTEDPAVALEQIMLASHLMRIVDRRRIAPVQ